MKKPRIFVLEDDRPSRKMICKILEKVGYDAIECPEGRDAIHMTMMHPPEVILVDIMLPDMQGTDVVKELQVRKDCEFVEYIFLTAILSEKASGKESKFQFEVDGTRHQALAKPIKKSVLLELIKKSVANSRNRKARFEENTKKPKNEVTKVERDLEKENYESPAEAEVGCGMVTLDIGESNLI